MAQKINLSELKKLVNQIMNESFFPPIFPDDEEKLKEIIENLVSRTHTNEMMPLEDVKNHMNASIEKIYDKLKKGSSMNENRRRKKGKLIKEGFYFPVSPEAYSKIVDCMRDAVYPHGREEPLSLDQFKETLNSLAPIIYHDIVKNN